MKLKLKVWRQKNYNSQGKIVDYDIKSPIFLKDSTLPEIPELIIRYPFDVTE